MTNEEAIKILKSKMDGSVDTSYEWAETVRMAIKAIKALEQTDTTGDTISRQAAIDALMEYSEMYAVNIIKSLSSARSEPDWTEIMVICDNCGHAVHAKRENCKVSAQPKNSKEVNRNERKTRL